MAQLSDTEGSVVIFRSHYLRRARLIADMLDARGFRVEVREDGSAEPTVAVANSHATRARELLMCYGLQAETTLAR